MDSALLCALCAIFVPFVAIFFTTQNTQRKLLLLIFLPCIFFPINAVANTWGTNLFATHRHDFGQVVLGADAEFRFELTNTHNSDLRLLSVRSSCSCTTARFSTSLLKPGETGAVIARMNTSGQHLHRKSAVLTVQLETVINGTSRIDTVQLFVSGYIRPDVLLNPGSIEFGSISKGTSAVRTLQLEYTGRPGWALTGIERSQPFIYARAEETRREHGAVAYKITAILREDAPPGYVRDVLRFTTNELQPGRAEPVKVMIPVHGVVTATIQAKPSPMQIGVLAPGETAVKNIVLRNVTPFRVTNVTASDNRFRFAFSDRENTVQLITIAFSASQFPQDVSAVIRISTDDSRQDAIVVNVFGRVMTLESHERR